MASRPLDDSQILHVPFHAPSSKSSSKSSKSSSTHTLSSIPDTHGLRASSDARRIVRLAQCTQCSHPLREPVILPCGSSICKRCFPISHLRTNISYPATRDRLQGFTCPLATCGEEHAVQDCSVDVTLSAIAEEAKAVVHAHIKEVECQQDIIMRNESSRLAETSAGTALAPIDTGRISHLYTLAEQGKLLYNDAGDLDSIIGNDTEVQDVALLHDLKAATRRELDCQVCYALFLDPLTTACGHTFCRSCIQRATDHTPMCPICRRALHLPRAYGVVKAPLNTLLNHLLMEFCPEDMAARAESARKEDAEDAHGELNTALFVCTTSFPNMPTYLHVFEPRYRLMMRRAYESEHKTFGMVLDNSERELHDELGHVPFYAYGTILRIMNMEVFRDGRSIVEAVGLSRFRVLKHGIRDGYLVGKVERIDDISIAEEEALEAAETTESSAGEMSTVGEFFGDLPDSQSLKELSQRQSRTVSIDAVSTVDLMKIATNYVKYMQASSQAWLPSRLTPAFGECPFDDPATFPWWFASIFPQSEQQRYSLLPMTSVRDRLKCCVEWIVDAETRARGQGLSLLKLNRP